MRWCRKRDSNPRPTDYKSGKHVNLIKRLPDFFQHESADIAAILLGFAGNLLEDLFIKNGDCYGS